MPHDNQDGPKDMFLGNEGGRQVGFWPDCVEEEDTMETNEIQEQWLETSQRLRNPGHRCGFRDERVASLPPQGQPGSSGTPVETPPTGRQGFPSGGAWTGYAPLGTAPFPTDLLNGKYDVEFIMYQKQVPAPERRAPAPGGNVFCRICFCVSSTLALP